MHHEEFEKSQFYYGNGHGIAEIGMILEKGADEYYRIHMDKASWDVFLECSHHGTPPIEPTRQFIESLYAPLDTHKAEEAFAGFPS